ncbi:MAG TPA: hypothetical protein VMR98_03435 [Candidatus Polarisedimenticolaceae bacterium]|nr:hypothetical protein [Candidatus Polarisedimenticolaceae bacterium]
MQTPRVTKTGAAGIAVVVVAAPLLFKLLKWVKGRDKPAWMKIHFLHHPTKPESGPCTCRVVWKVVKNFPVEFLVLIDPKTFWDLKPFARGALGDLVSQRIASRWAEHLDPSRVAAAARLLSASQLAGYFVLFAANPLAFNVGNGLAVQDAIVRIVMQDESGDLSAQVHAALCDRLHAQAYFHELIAHA